MERQIAPGQAVGNDKHFVPFNQMTYGTLGLCVLDLAFPKIQNI